MADVQVDVECPWCGTLVREARLDWEAKRITLFHACPALVSPDIKIEFNAGKADTNYDFVLGDDGQMHKADTSTGGNQE